MQQSRSFYRTECSLLLVSLALLFLASACAPGAASTVTGVGCSDPSCTEVQPETRKVIGCIGEACNEPPPPGAAKPQAAPNKSNSASQPAAATGTDSPAPPAADAEADATEFSPWNIKIFYEKYERP